MSCTTPDALSNARANLAGVGGGWKRSQPAAFRRSMAGTRGQDREARDDDAPQPAAELSPASDVAASGPTANRPGGTHCWVVMPDTDPVPGLVGTWRQTSTGEWQARVTYALGDVETASVVTG